MYAVTYLALLAPLAAAFTPPKDATYGALLLPDLTHPVTAGETFEIKWDPSGHAVAGDGKTVSLVLCRGPGANCVPSDTAIVEKVDASKGSYSWNVPSDLEPGEKSTKTGAGILIIEDGTGDFQYSTQFDILKGEGSDSKPSDKESGANNGSWATRTDEPTPSETGYAGGKNGTVYTHTKTGTSTTSAVESVTSKYSKASTTLEIQTATDAQTTGTAPTGNSQPTATPAVQTELSGAARNAAGALFLGAIAAAVML